MCAGVVLLLPVIGSTFSGGGVYFLDGETTLGLICCVCKRVVCLTVGLHSLILYKSVTAQLTPYRLVLQHRGGKCQH